MPYGDRRLYGVCVAEKGTFRFNVSHHRHRAHASVPGLADNALLKLAPVITRLGEAPPALRPDRGRRARCVEAIGEDPADPEARRSSASPPSRRGSRRCSTPRCASRSRPTIVSAGEKINVIPARAQVRVDCRVPPGMGEDVALKRAREVLGDDGYELEFTEAVVGNRSPVESPLMDAIGDWVAEHDPGAEAVPTVLPAFTDCRWFRAAFPDCVAYGFFPQRHQTVYETWPLMHAADERIDVRDLGFAAAFFHDLPGRLLLMPVPEDKLRLGGMALRNGLLVHGPTHWAAAVRANDGDVKVASGPQAARDRARRHPGRCAGSRASARRSRSSRWSSAGCPRPSWPSRTRRCSASPPARRSPARAASSARLRGTGGELAAALIVARARAVRAARRRAGRLPRRRAQGDRGLRGRRRRTPPTPPRSTSAAART